MTKQLTKNEISQKIKRYPALRFSSPYRKAAVALICVNINESIHILFVKRNAELKEHAGEISFPGGRFHIDDGESIQTAIRETMEETNIQLDKTQFLGNLNDIITNTHYHLSPFVFFLDAKPDLMLSSEHSDYFFFPLSELMNEEIHEAKSLIYQQQRITIHYYRYQEEVIWGASGLIFHNFLSLVSHG